MTVPLAIRLHPADNVVVAQVAIPAGTTVPGEEVTALGPVAAGHKMATRSIARDEPVRRYGQIIGFATRDIAAGEHVHNHNLEMRDFARDHAFSTLTVPTGPLQP